MENIDSKFVKDVWKKKGSKLKAPKVFFAVYSSKVYYVYRDDSFIIFMIPSNCDVTYTLPKKYCKLKEKDGNKYYQISSIENASVVSCIGRKNEYEKLVIDNIVVYRYKMLV